MTVGADPNFAYEPAKWFQSHGVDQVGSPLKDCTRATEPPFYLFDYSSMGTLLANMYASIGSSTLTLKQRIRVSGHMDYTLRNSTNDFVTYDVVRWTFKKMPPAEVFAITTLFDPARVTDPILYANPLNLIGAAIVACGYTTTGGPTALNSLMDDAQITLKELPLWNEFVEYKQFTVKIPPGQTRHFKVGVRLLEIDTIACFAQLGTVAFGNPDSWTLPFIPGSTGLIFRMHGTMSTSDTISYTTDYQKAIYSRPQCILQCRTAYTVYDWLANPETQDSFLIRETGILANAFGNAATSIIDRNDAKVEVTVSGM